MNTTFDKDELLRKLVDRLLVYTRTEIDWETLAFEFGLLQMHDEAWRGIEVLLNHRLTLEIDYDTRGNRDRMLKLYEDYPPGRELRGKGVCPIDRFANLVLQLSELHEAK